MYHTSRHDRQAGFTLVELVVVVVILGILTSIAVASYVMTVKQAHRVACRANQRMLTEALIQYEANSGGIEPVDLDELGTWVKDINKIQWCPADRRSLVIGGLEVYCTYPDHRF